MAEDDIRSRYEGCQGGAQSRALVHIEEDDGEQTADGDDEVQRVMVEPEGRHRACEQQRQARRPDAVRLFEIGIAFACE
jgi:hypothetical protein